eukprot:Filipodium_phascolosomae@DN448_c0_g1_i1.p1
MFMFFVLFFFLVAAQPPQYCRCNKKFSPVCVIETQKTYSNKCTAQCDLQRILDPLEFLEGQCQPSASCACPGKDPVCVNGKTYDNECRARCDLGDLDGGQVLRGTCCGCDSSYEPVCRNYEEYWNGCIAKCFDHLIPEDSSSLVYSPPCSDPPCDCESNIEGKVCMDGASYASVCEAQCSPNYNFDSVIEQGQCNANELESI